MEADKKTTTEEAGFFKKYGFYLALAVLAVIVMLPNPEGLSVAGQRMIGIMVFSVIVWATTAISYPVSAGVIMTLMALLIGFAPNPETGKLFGRTRYRAERLCFNSVLLSGGSHVPGRSHD